GEVAGSGRGPPVGRALGGSLMSRSHAGWSIGRVAGAGAGAAMVALGVPVTVHLLAVALAVAAVVPIAARRFLPHAPAPVPTGAGERDGRAVRRSPLRAWTEPRTLLIGLFMLCMAFTEGTSNHWLSLAVIGGYHTPAAPGTPTPARFPRPVTTRPEFGAPV